MAEHLKGIGEEPLEGIGGWLWLVALGIVASPLRIIFLIFPLYSEIFKDGSWEILTSSGTEAYHPMWAPIILAEMTINAALVLTWIFVGFLFFLKKAIFPKFYIGTLLFTLVFIIIDAMAVKIIFPNDPIFDPDTTKELVRTLVACLIWIPYILISKRVQATFVKEL